ncbi:MAG: Zn-ribbon domain-containing OB-fold protein [bacterium]
MSAAWLESVEPMVHHSRIKVPYTWSVGETGSRFLAGIRDHKRLQGKQCESCKTVYVPPRKMCPRCFRDTGPWVDVGPDGTLLTYTIVRYENGLQPARAPFAYGIIQLDGASTGLLHLIGDVDLSSIRSGLRLTAVFKEERTGTILDIAHFRPVKSA